MRTGSPRANSSASGRKLDLRQITCPVYLLAGAADDITTPEQVLGAKKYIGTPKERIAKKPFQAAILGFSWEPAP